MVRVHKSILVVVSVIAVLGLSGCGSSAGDPAEAYHGTWKTNEGWYLEFRDDGTFGFGGSVERIATDPLEWGTYTFDGEVLRLTTADDSTYCTGIEAAYEAVPTEDGTFIAQTAIEDECPSRRSDLGRGITRYP
jgi:hypothetical protein